MAQNIVYHVRDMVEAARKEINEISAQEVIEMSDNDYVVIVDLRDIRERMREGYIENSQHVPRGMLEFWIDPDSPYHKPLFAEDKHFIFHCASGWRSALATLTAKRMGLKPVSHIEGGFSAWKTAGGAITNQTQLG